MTREAIQGALISVSVILGIPVLRSRDAEESARLMLYASRQLRSVISGAVARPSYRPKSKLRTQLRILQALPEVGPVRAARLLDKYGSVEAVLTAGREDLTLVPGIGKVAAERIRWAVTEPDKAYLYTRREDPEREPGSDLSLVIIRARGHCLWRLPLPSAIDQLYTKM